MSVCRVLCCRDQVVPTSLGSVRLWGRQAMQCVLVCVPVDAGILVLPAACVLFVLLCAHQPAHVYICKRLPASFLVLVCACLHT